MNTVSYTLPTLTSTILIAGKGIAYGIAFGSAAAATFLAVNSIATLAIHYLGNKKQQAALDPSNDWRALIIYPVACSAISLVAVAIIGSQASLLGIGITAAIGIVVYPLLVLREHQEVSEEIKPFVKRIAALGSIACLTTTCIAFRILLA